jgi:hypothetical protein
MVVQLQSAQAAVHMGPDTGVVVFAAQPSGKPGVIVELPPEAPPLPEWPPLPLPVPPPVPALEPGWPLAPGSGLKGSPLRAG